jgi:transcriptional regulator with XRE-family HTH domain
VINRQTLWQYEQGTVAAPDPVALMRLAEIYDTDIASLISVLAANRRNPNLTEAEVHTILQDVRETHGTNAAAAAHLAELTDEIRIIGTELIGLTARAEAIVRGQAADPGTDAEGHPPRTRRNRGQATAEVKRKHGT